MDILEAVLSDEVLVLVLRAIKVLNLALISLQIETEISLEVVL